ncbi:hypothetical protein OIV83_005349 [Microbotryomycetes sp. JL201]|nr:hypothetical protein OIV83_005349 [Microbotryomycetes sp. JL201]
MLRTTRGLNPARKSCLTRTLASHASITPPPELVEGFAVDQRDKLPIFTVSKERGHVVDIFLPRVDPQQMLPKAFAPLESLLNRMTIIQRDGSRGLLALGQFGDAVKSELDTADLIRKVENVIKAGDRRLISALFRDFGFCTSAYLLEPVDLSFRATGQYSVGRDVLPECLAKPMSLLADATGSHAYLDYVSYALQNYVRLDPQSSAETVGDPAAWAPENLALIRAFENSTGSEAGFILVHVAMVAYTGQVVNHTENVLKAANERDRVGFRHSMSALLDVFRQINRAMDTMWSWSRPVDYLSFRTFIMGLAPKHGNRMFPTGVIYEGVSDEPQYFRGESGSQDNIIPVADNLLQITKSLPDNELTRTLREFRHYRPSAQRIYVDTLEARATEANVADFAKADKQSLAYYILMLDQVREFRDRHWRFVKSYIIKYSDYNIATGGSPILHYLPNNLRTVLGVMADAFTLLPSSADLPPELAAQVDAVRGRAETQLRVLDREVTQFESQVKGVDDKRASTWHDGTRWNKGMVGCDGVG